MNMFKNRFVLKSLTMAMAMGSISAVANSHALGDGQGLTALNATLTTPNQKIDSSAQEVSASVPAEQLITQAAPSITQTQSAGVVSGVVGSYQSSYPNSYLNDYTASQFNDMERAATRGDMAALYRFEQSMPTGLFAIYPVYWRLYGNLTSQDPNTIINFIRQHQGSALAEKLVADYAERKAEQGDYAAVRAVAPYITNADASETCAIGLGFNQSSEYQKTLEQKPTAWLNTMTRVPSLCDKLADEMVYNQGISQKDLSEQLVRMMRLDGRRLSSKQPATNKTTQIVNLSNRLGLGIGYGLLGQIKVNPYGFFPQFANDPKNVANQYLYIYAISQLAHNSYRQAINQLEQDIAQNRLTPAISRYAYRAIAVKRMNMNTDDGFNIEVVQWFKASRGEPFNQEEAEDYAQAAIYFGQWEDVVHAISKMHVQFQKERVWQYWLGRAYEQLGNKTHADAFYRSLAGGLDYYGMLSKARLGQPLTLQDVGGNQPPMIGENERNLVMSDVHFARALNLMRQGAKSEHTTREWNWAVKKARDSNNQRLIVLAAKMAQELGNYPRSIYAMENSPAKNGAVSHPVLFQNAFVGYANRFGIDPAWSMGITRQESRFQTSAQSTASAQGLMQIIPSTARQIARGLGESVGNMNNPDTNIRYGSWYLAKLSGDVGGQLAVATAGYNAGPNAARAWRPKSGNPISADQYVEAIPYSETRDYVKNVMANATVYGVLLGNPVPITQRMGMVSPVW